MPPYLLGIERATMDPMKISEAVQLLRDGGPSTGDFPKGVDMYMILRNGLILYIQVHLSTGVYRPDDMIQRAACLMMYGSDDPFNQTFAENPTWLAALKSDVHHGTSKTLPGRHVMSAETVCR